MNNKIQKIINYLIIVYIFLLPWQTAYIFDEKILNGAKWQAGTGVFYTTELILGMIFLLFIWSQIIDSKKIAERLAGWRSKMASDKARIVLLVWLFLAWSGLSIFWSIDKAGAFYLWFHLLEGAALFFIILNSRIVTKKLLWALAAAGGLQGLLATGQFLTQTITANKFLGLASHSAGVLGDIVIETADGRWLRAYGSLAHPNILGGLMVLGLIAASLLWISYWQSPLLVQKWNNSWPRSELKKFVSVWMKLLTLIGLSLLMTAGLFFSFSRSAWLSGFVAGLFLVILGGKQIIKNQKQNNKFSIFNFQFSIFYFSPLILFLILALIFSPLISARTDFTNRLEAQSNTQRLTQIGQATRLISEQPLTGVGLNNYTLTLAKINPGQPAYVYQPIHNLYLLIFAELGAVGIILFFILLINIIAYALKQIKITLLLWLNFIPLSTILIICFFDHYFWTQYTGVMIFWLSLTFLLKNDNFVIQQEIEL